jgi:hypothetical protein
MELGAECLEKLVTSDSDKRVQSSRTDPKFNLPTTGEK